jgi:hypothetical protein
MVCGSNPNGRMIFHLHTRPGISIPPSHPYNWYCCSLPGIKREGLRVDYPLPIRAEVQNVPSLRARIACYAETFTFIVYMQVWIPINLALNKSSTHHILGSLSDVSSINVGTLIEKKNKCLNRTFRILRNVSSAGTRFQTAQTKGH